jgi:hypothetical protein
MPSGQIRRIIEFAVCCCLAATATGRLAIASDHAAPAGSEHSATAGGDSGHAESTTYEDRTKSGTHGIDLGEFRVRVYHVAESQKSSASFSLYATVEKDRLAELKQLMEHRRHKLRDQVIVVTRLLPLSDFDDPDLKTFRRRILLQLRRALPELAIENVYISDFELQVERI